MKAIFTKLLPCTNFKGSRVKAYDSDGNQKTLSWDHAGNTDDNHQAAAVALCHKMRWFGTLVRGSHKNVEVFVFIETFTERRILEQHQITVKPDPKIIPFYGDTGRKEALNILASYLRLSGVSQ